MYCSSCGKTVMPGLSFCNHCGVQLSGKKKPEAGEMSEASFNFLIAALLGMADDAELRDHDRPTENRRDEERQQDGLARERGVLEGVDEPAVGGCEKESRKKRCRHAQRIALGKNAPCHKEIIYLVWPTPGLHFAARLCSARNPLS